jgi:Uma2 family endonuclease
MTVTRLRRNTPYHTYADYLTWPDGQRDELINGIAYVKEPAPSRSHQEIVGELYFQIRLALEGKPWRAYVAPFDVRLPKAGEADARVDTVVQPDVLVVSDLGKLDQRGMRGAPDWLAEVLSPASAAHDRVVKLPVYERAGVLEVWFVHPTDRTVTIYRLQDARYGRPTVLDMKGRTPITAVPGVSINWDRVPAVID